MTEIDHRPIDPETGQPVERRRKWHRRVDSITVSLSTAALLVSIVGATVGFTSIRSDRIERERQDVSLRQIAFRICQREAVDRAFAHSFAKTLEQRRNLQSRLPILDCEPNISGLPARAMPPRMQDEFLRRYLADMLTPREQGLCLKPITSGGCS